MNLFKITESLYKHMHDAEMLVGYGGLLKYDRGKLSL